jgi:hypothetical protein
MPKIPKFSILLNFRVFSKILSHFISMILGKYSRFAEFNEAAYQVAFRTPGISPLRASSRKQIRQRPNLR